MKDITILLPIYKLEAEDIGMLNNALSSVSDFHNDVKITIICPSDLKEKIGDMDFGQKLEVKILYNTTSNTDFASQINIGIDDCDTEWFSILEVDDEYKKPWISTFNEHVKVYIDVDVFLPIVRDINVEGSFIGFTNESLWAYGFSKKQGYLDTDILLEFQNFQTSGGIYRTKVIKEVGKFKNNIKLVFTYEFLLRLAHNNINIMSLPKIGYQHVNFRENSLFWKYKNDENMKLSEKEVKFWIETAKKEYFFKNKREIKYTED